MNDFDEESKPEYICGAKTRSGMPCRRRPTYQGLWYQTENPRCHMHGGKSLKGFAHPNFKHGRYSKVLKSLGTDEEAEAVKQRKRMRQIKKAERDFIKKHKRQPTFDEFSQLVNESRNNQKR